jgi:hypothetical protein
MTAGMMNSFSPVTRNGGAVNVLLHRRLTREVDRLFKRLFHERSALL